MDGDPDDIEETAAAATASASAAAVEDRSPGEYGEKGGWASGVPGAEGIPLRATLESEAVWLTYGPAVLEGLEMDCSGEGRKPSGWESGWMGCEVGRESEEGGGRLAGRACDPSARVPLLCRW